MRFLSVIIFFLLSLTGFSQPDKLSNFWYFGDMVGLDFSTSTPTIKTDGKMTALTSGMSVVSDEIGNLMLYSDGKQVWNRYHEVMKGTENLSEGSVLSTHNGLLVPNPANRSQYYVFYMVDGDLSGKVEIKYALVDMSLNGGKGSAVSTNMILAKDACRTFALFRHCNNVDFWLITHETGNNNFRAYLINEKGVSSTPVVSSMGSVHKGSVSQAGQLRRYTTMKPSYDGSKLAVALTKEDAANGAFLEVIDFNSKTGKFTQVSYKQNWQKFPTSSINDLAFSADAKKVYVSRTTYKKIDSKNEEYQSDLFQVDLTKSNSDAASLNLIASKIFKLDAAKTDGEEVKGIGGIQMGSNGKLYIAYNLTTYLGVINNPNNAGVSSNFVEKGLNFSSKNVGWMLPSVLPIKRVEGLAAISFTFTPDGCNGVLSSIYRGLDKSKTIQYQWYLNGVAITNANDSTYKVKQPGTYQVFLSERDGCTTATSNSLRVFGQSFPPPQKSAGYIPVCEGGVLPTLTAIGTNVKWYEDKKLQTPLHTGNSFTPKTIPVNRKKYVVYITQTNASNCESAADSIEVELIPRPKLVFEERKIFACLEKDINNKVTVSASNYNGLEWLYKNTVVDTDTLLKATNYGFYVVKATNGSNCVNRDSVEFVASCAGIYLPEAFTPNRDNINDKLRIYGENIVSFDIYISNRASKYVYISKENQFDGEFLDTWDGTVNGEDAPSGTYYYFIEAKINEVGVSKILKREGRIVLLR